MRNNILKYELELFTGFLKYLFVFYMFADLVLTYIGVKNLGVEYELNPIPHLIGFNLFFIGKFIFIILAFFLIKYLIFKAKKDSSKLLRLSLILSFLSGAYFLIILQWIGLLVANHII